MKTLVKFLLFAVSTVALSQIPAPQVPVTGNLGSGGNFPLLNNGTLVFTSDANHTMIYPEMSANFIKVTSSVALTAQRNLVAPLTSGFTFTIENSTTGGQSIKVIGPSGTGVVIPNGSAVVVACDGANYISAVASSGGSPGSPVGSRQFNAGSSTFGGNGQEVDALAFSGATADVKINNALAQVCPNSSANAYPTNNGTVNACGLNGFQSIAANITMPPNCTLKLGTGDWIRAIGAQIVMNYGSTLEGCNPALGYQANRGTAIIGTATDTAASIVMASGTTAPTIKDLAVFGPPNGLGIDMRHAIQAIVQDVSVSNVATGITFGYPGGCDCYDSFYDLYVFTTGTAMDLESGTNQNHFYGGRYQSSGGSAVFDNGDVNVFFAPDFEGNSTAIEFGPLSGAGYVSSAYSEANTQDVLLDSGASGNAIIGGGFLFNVTDNSGNTSNLIWTFGDSVTEGGNSPNVWAAHDFRLGGNLWGGGQFGIDFSLIGGGVLDQGAQFNYSTQATSVYGRNGGAPLHVGPLYNAGATYLSGGSIYTLPNPAPPTLAVVGTTGSTTLTYYVVCYTDNTVTAAETESLPSSVATVTNANATLSVSNYVTITPACGAGYTGAHILKGGTSGTVFLANFGPNQAYSDIGASLASFSAVTRNSTGDWSIGGNLAAAQFNIGANVVIPPSVTGYQGTSGTKVQLGVGTPTVGHCGDFAADGSIQDAGAACAAPATLTTGTPTVGQAACIKAAGPPVVIGFCSTVVGAGGACTCN